MISAETRARIKGYVEGMIQHTVEKILERERWRREGKPRRGSKSDAGYKPFHYALIPEGVRRVSEFERTFSTSLGSSFEEVGMLVASEHHGFAKRTYELTGGISLSAVSFIESAMKRIDESGVFCSYPELVAGVTHAATDTNSVTRTVRADLFVKTRDNEEWYFEIKTPEANKGQCLELTSRLLHICAMRRSHFPKVKTYFAMGYNPYGEERSLYRWNVVLRYTDLQNQVLIGKEFWDLLGGDGTYEELLSIYKEVGREKGKELIDRLALNY